MSLHLQLREASELHPKTPCRGIRTKGTVRKTQKGGYRCEGKEAAWLNAASSHASREVKCVYVEVVPDSLCQ